MCPVVIRVTNPFHAGLTFASKCVTTIHVIRRMVDHVGRCAESRCRHADIRALIHVTLGHSAPIACVVFW
jgi:hypothetical protein